MSSENSGSGDGMGLWTERLGTSGDWGSDQVSPHEPVASHLALFSQGALPLLGLPPWEEARYSLDLRSSKALRKLSPSVVVLVGGRRESAELGLLASFPAICDLAMQQSF